MGEIRFIDSVFAHRSLVLCIAAIWFSICNGEDLTSGCREEERLALLQFKNGGLLDPSGRLSSWAGADCCAWRSVRCSNRTGHVTKLLLGSPSEPGEDDKYLGGNVSSSLLQLKHLRYLDLSRNYFDGISIPRFFGSLSKLRYLNLSDAAFGGIIPHQLGNLSELRYLDLSWIHIPPSRPVVDNLHWLSGLSSLQHLDMSAINLAEADVFNVVSGLPGLKVLRLSNCWLDRMPASLRYLNLTYSLASIDISANYFTSVVPDWVFNFSRLESVDFSENGWHGSISRFGDLSSLRSLRLGRNSFNASIPSTFRNLCSFHTLDLSYNGIEGDGSVLAKSLDGCARYSLQTLNLEGNLLSGKLPAQIGNFRSLEGLYLDNNRLSGPIPSSIGRLSSLKYLRLANNRFEGPIPVSLGMLSELVVMDLSFNSLEGVISDAHIDNLTKLEALFLSSNSLAMRTSSNWIPRFQLKNIHLDSCVLGPEFPAWLRTQTVFSTIDISNAGIFDTMPNWFWNLSSRVRYLNVSHNQISGSIPVSVTLNNIEFVDLRSNLFHGPLPHIGDGVVYLYLSDNFFSGDLLPIFNNSTTSLSTVLLSRNRISGGIPASVCRLDDFLDLSSNFLSGEIPRCSGFLSLSVINLASNNLSGVIPSWIGSVSFLQILHTNNNNFHGEIPSLENCSMLAILDLGENRLTGKIPEWIGESLSYLKILRLKSNFLEGSIPHQLSHLKDLQVLDLADNKLSGNMPWWLGNLSAMTLSNQTISSFTVGEFSSDTADYESLILTPTYEESLLVTIKGMELEYSTTLSLVLSLDLSGNNLSGDIPEELSALLGLQNLNLSNNHLKGVIPESIGVLRQLQSLDLSRNRLYGVIPASISSLTYLSHLNLSNNNLSGRIPSGNQIQVLNDPSIYTGNPNLCGTQLPKKCRGDETAKAPTLATTTEDGEEQENLWYYIGSASGFVVGFWVVCGPLLLNKSWRVSYFKAVDSMFNYCRFC